MSSFRHKVAAVVALLVVTTAGCGGRHSDPIVVRVGALAIERTTVDHWARAIQLGSTVEGALGQASSSSRQKALELLISSAWAIGAAAEGGLTISSNAVARGLRERIETAPHGRSEFEEEIAATGQTLTDIEFEVKDSLAASALRESIFRRVPPLTRTQLVAYYKRHLHSFRIPERRLVDLIEYIDGYEQAVALGKRLGTGERFARWGMRELVARQTPYEDAHRANGRMVRAIFATPPGRMGGPVMFHGKWVLLVVRKLVPSAIKPLEAVRAELGERLTGARRQRAMTSFLEAYGREWRAKTRCEAGFVVPRCSEYRGRPAPEPALLLADPPAIPQPPLGSSLRGRLGGTKSPSVLP